MGWCGFVAGELEVAMVAKSETTMVACEYQDFLINELH